MNCFKAKLWRHTCSLHPLKVGALWTKGMNRNWSEPHGSRVEAEGPVECYVIKEFWKSQSVVSHLKLGGQC